MKRGRRLKLLELPSNGIPNLLDRQREAARLLATGMKEKDVALQVGYHPAYMPNLKSQPAFKSHLDTLRTARDEGAVDIRSRVAQGASVGLDILVNILTPKTPENSLADIKTKAKVAQDLLDREGSAPKVSRAHVLGQHTHAILSREDIDEIKKAANMRRQGMAQIGA